MLTPLTRHYLAVRGGSQFREMVQNKRLGYMRLVHKDREAEPAAEGRRVDESAESKGAGQVRMQTLQVGHGLQDGAASRNPCGAPEFARRRSVGAAASGAILRTCYMGSAWIPRAHGHDTLLVATYACADAD